MWKAVIADDEGVILQGLKKLVDWTNMDVRLVGEARDGQRLKEVMEETDPDIVITDIMMPYRTGLDILRWCNEADMHAKFIFISGYQEFTYAKEALQSGAVDYLLKPVARKDLEDAVRKAIQKLEEQNTIEIFKEEDDEMYQLFREINDGQGFENDELYQLFEAEEIDFEGHFFVGICVGIRPDLAADMIKDSFERFNLLRFSIYNQIAQKAAWQSFCSAQRRLCTASHGSVPLWRGRYFRGNLRDAGGTAGVRAGTYRVISRDRYVFYRCKATEKCIQNGKACF